MRCLVLVCPLQVPRYLTAGLVEEPRDANVREIFSDLVAYSLWWRPFQGQQLQSLI